jgi:hypothetical protein
MTQGRWSTKATVEEADKGSKVTSEFDLAMDVIGE